MVGTDPGPPTIVNGMTAIIVAAGAGMAIGEFLYDPRLGCHGLQLAKHSWLPEARILLAIAHLVVSTPES